MLSGYKLEPTIVEKQKSASVFIKSVEGLKLKAYECAKGEISIGYGTRSYLGEEITLIEADKRFDRYLNKRVWHKVPESMSINQYAVYSSLVYNIPAWANDMLIKRNWIMRLFTRYDYVLDCKKILNYRKVDGEINQGIINRRIKEYKLCVSN